MGNKKNHNTVIHTILTVFFLVYSFISCAAVDRDYKKIVAQNGIFDINSWDFYSDGNVRLNGTWEFYWKQLPGPEQFIHRSGNLHFTGFVSVPGIWMNYKNSRDKLTAHGYGTYRLVIKNVDNRLIYGLIMPDTATADKVYINGKLHAQSGTVGTSKAESKAQYTNRSIYFPVENDEIEIIVQVSNFHYWKAGIWKPVVLGEAESISNEMIKRITMDLILIGALAVMCFYHLTLFILVKKDLSALYLCLFCFLIVIRTCVTGSIVLTQLFPGFNWELLIKLEICPFYIGLFLFTKLIYSLFPEIIPDFLVKCTFFYMLIFIPILIVTPAAIFSHLILPSQIIIVLFTSVELVLLIIGLLKKIQGSLFIISGFVILFFTVLNDTLHSNMIIHTAYLIPFGVLLFFFSQSFLLSVRLLQKLDKMEYGPATLQ